MADKLRAEWFWIDRWMGSSAFLLPMEARGLYREMLSQAWTRGARLPGSYEAIRRATGCTIEEWDRSWPEIAKYWHDDGDGNLVNDTQLEIYAKTIGISEKRAAVGSKGGKTTQAKQKQETKQAPEQTAKQDTAANGQANVKPPYPSLSLSPYQKQTPEERTNVPCDHAFARKRFAETGRTTICACGEEFRSVSANPFVGDRRPQLESESLKLTEDIAALTGDDPAEVFRTAAHYEGAKGAKYNPATMSDERLLATVSDLRATLKALEARQPRQKPVSA